MKRYTIDFKEIELEIHVGNYNRRVKYNEKDFEFLIVSVLDNVCKRYFAISVESLPDNDSIHLSYNPLSREIRWIPNIGNVVEVTQLYKIEWSKSGKNIS